MRHNSSPTPEPASTAAVGPTPAPSPYITISPEHPLWLAFLETATAPRSRRVELFNPLRGGAPAHQAPGREGPEGGRAYSPFFKLLYDQPAPVGYLGRGTHYSVLRAVVWHDATLAPLQRSRFHDFAILWDEDHDERVVPLVERIYFAGLLAPMLFLGERKGALYAVTSPLLPREKTHRFVAALEALSQDQDDPWTCDEANVAAFDPGELGGAASGIVDDASPLVDAYLRGIDLLWALGPKAIKR